MGTSSLTRASLDTTKSCEYFVGIHQDTCGCDSTGVYRFVAPSGSVTELSLCENHRIVAVGISNAIRNARHARARKTGASQ